MNKSEQPDTPDTPRARLLTPEGGLDVLNLYPEDTADTLSHPGPRKYCKGCRRSRPFSCFYIDNRSRDRLRFECIDCVKRRKAGKGERRSYKQPLPKYATPRKVCCQCKKYRKKKHFYGSDVIADGLGTRCKDCQKKYDLGRTIRRQARRVLASGHERHYRALVREANTLQGKHNRENLLDDWLRARIHTAGGPCILCGTYSPILYLYDNKTPPYRTRYALPLCPSCLDEQRTAHGDRRPPVNPRGK